MADIMKPPFDIGDEEDPFLIQPGQPGSYVDALAAAQGPVTTTRINISSGVVALIILEVRR